MNELLEEGLEVTSQKKGLSKQMNEIASERAEQIGLTKQQILALKDYKHYYGAGWGADALDKSEEKCKFPDRITPTFRRLVKIVSNLRDADMLDMLQPYLDACAARGIKVTIEAEETAVQKTHNAQLLEDTINDVDALQCEICELNDRLTDGLAPAAEETHFTPKSKFKNVVEHAYRVLNKNKEKAEEKIDEQVADNNLYTAALDDVKKL